MANGILHHSPYLFGVLVDAPVGLVIVSTTARRNVMTVSLFSEVAHFPTSMWVAIAPGALTHSLLIDSGRFSFITLHQGQAELARICGTTSGREGDKCSGIDLYDDGQGFLFLRNALASTACTVSQAVSVGDHTLIIAHMRSGDITPRQTGRRQLLLSDLRRR